MAPAPHKISWWPRVPSGCFEHHRRCLQVKLSCPAIPNPTFSKHFKQRACTLSVWVSFTGDNVAMLKKHSLNRCQSKSGSKLQTKHSMIVVKRGAGGDILICLTAMLLFLASSTIGVSTTISSFQITGRERTSLFDENGMLTHLKGHGRCRLRSRFLWGWFQRLGVISHLFYWGV